MDSGRLAEWILSLVLPPDRAASVVGDWIEDASARGSLWFWACVVRTVTARITKDIADSPFYLTGLAIRGCLLNLWGMACCLIGFMVLMIPAFVLTGWLAPTSWVKALGILVGEAAVLVAAFQTGRWLAKRAPDREAAVCVAMLVVQPMLYLAAGFIVWHVWGAQIERYAGNYPDYAVASPWFQDYNGSLFNICLFAGVLRTRLQSTRRLSA